MICGMLKHDSWICRESLMMEQNILAAVEGVLFHSISAPLLLELYILACPSSLVLARLVELNIQEGVLVHSF